MKRVLVTGGAGFLGSHLCGRLLAQGHTVVCLDDFSTGYQGNIAALVKLPGFTVHKLQVAHANVLRGPFDEVYNLACPASPVHYQADPVRTLLTCVYGAQAVLELACGCGAKVLQASTSEIYGDPLVHPQKERDFGHVNPIGPRACYDEGKRAAEALFFDHHRQHRTRIKVARIFNTYGPRMRPDDGRVVSNFIVSALAGTPLTIFGDGAQTRSFCYVDDLIDALLLLMETDDAVTGPLNLGNPREITIAALADFVVRMTGAQVKIEAAPKLQDDPFRRCPEIKLAERLLNWSPKVELGEGLERTIAYFRELPKKAAA